MSRRGRKENDKSGNIYFVTTTVMNYQKILTLKESYTKMVIESLKYLIAEHKAILFAYVIIPSHIHFIIRMRTNESISNFMRDFKKFTSKELYKRAKIDGNLVLIRLLKHNSYKGGIKLWMDRFDSQIIKTERFLKQKINYIHYNPVKAGLVDETTHWPYSSAGKYYLDDNGLIEVSVGWEL